MLERDVEEYLRKKVQTELKGRALKFVSPGNSGVPDRIVLWPVGRIAFIELKAPGKIRRPLQIRWGDILSGMGFLYYCVDTKERVDDFIKEVMEI